MNQEDIKKCCDTPGFQEVDSRYITSDEYQDYLVVFYECTACGEKVSLGYKVKDTETKNGEKRR